MRIMDLAQAIAPGAPVRHIGIRPGEKIHETLLTIDESRNTVENDDLFLIKPSFIDYASPPDMKPVREGYSYSSADNPRWLSIEDLREKLQVI
jgi:UDP-N-acetylglucosamine 4,6-dehydratase